MLWIMNILVSYANLKTMAKILGIFFWNVYSIEQKLVCNWKRSIHSPEKCTKIQLLPKRCKCILRCDHKPLEPFLSRIMKIAKLDKWVMLLQEYDITFVHIRGKDNITHRCYLQIKNKQHIQKTVENKPQQSLATQGTAHSSKVTEDIQLLNSGTPPITPQHKYCNAAKPTKNKISFVKTKYVNYI